MRKKHHEQYSQPRFLDLFRQVATYWMKDDHDHRFDDSDAVNPVRIRAPKQLDYYPRTNIHEGESGSGFEPSHELGIEVFQEQMPVADPAERDPVTYRTHRVSRDLQVWLVEGRDYRSPLDQPDGPRKTIWGTKQKAWLLKTLKESDATFKLLLSATPMVGPDSSSKRDNHTNINGYRHEGDEFFRWLAANAISGDEFFVACGDRHWQYHSIRPDGYEEFSSGALVDANAILGSFPGDANTTDPEGRIQQPFHAPEASGGFLIISVVPDGTSARAEFRFYDEKGALLYKHVKRPAAQR
jgi:alkaline phosphatase/alkaline phosphatase D